MMGKKLNRKAQSSFLARRLVVGENQIEIHNLGSNLGEIYYEYPIDDKMDYLRLRAPRLSFQLWFE